MPGSRPTWTPSTRASRARRRRKDEEAKLLNFRDACQGIIAVENAESFVDSDIFAKAEPVVEGRGDA